MKRDPLKVYDARWEVGEFSDAEVTRLFAATFAYARELGVDTVTFARDARLAGAPVMDLGVREALRLGFRVFATPEPIGTPQSYFTTLRITQRHPRTMGLTVTASHNPASYIGVKFTVPTVQAIGLDCGPLGGLTRIRGHYHSERRFPARSGGTLTLLDLTEDFVETSLQSAGVRPGGLEGLRVVLDGFNGSAGAVMLRTLQRAGVIVRARRWLGDGTFPGGSPNPTSQGKMQEAVALCRKHRCDAVLGLDGDGDRMVFGDRRGLLSAGFVAVAVLVAAGVTGRRRPAKVLYDPKVSPLALAEWGRMGVEPVLFRNGHSQIKDYMQRIGAVAAAEESGHYYHRIRQGRLSVSSENNLLTTLLFLGAVKKDKGLLDRLWTAQRRGFTTGEFNYQFPSDARRDEALAALVAHFEAQGAKKISATPDGIDLQGICLDRGVDLTPGRVRLAKGWVAGYVRAATNEKGIVRSYFSSGDTRTGRRVEAETRALLGERFGGQIAE